MGEHRRFDVHHRAHADRVAVMLIERQDVETQVLGVAIFVELVVVIVGRSIRVEEPIRNGEERPIPEYPFFG
jgi:hypothetical protein